MTVTDDGMERIAAGEACFERRDDAAHLRRHPNQTVASLRLTWHGFSAEDGHSPGWGSAARCAGESG